MATGSNRILSIDVECAATGYTHEDRSPCSVAIVDDKYQIIFSSLIKPAEKVVSDLYPFTGLRIKDLEQAPLLEDVLQKIYSLFDSTTIIVGQSPKNDVKWLKLEKGVHYASTIDLSDWFKVYNPRFSSMNYFSLAHEAWILLSIDLKYKDNEREKEEARRLLLNNRPRMMAARACNYNYEGVCLPAFYKQMCFSNRPSLANN